MRKVAWSEENKVKNKCVNNDKEINFDLNKKLVRFITHLKNTSTTWQTVKRKQKKAMGYITPAMGWIDGKYWSPLWYVMLTKVMNST